MNLETIGKKQFLGGGHFGKCYVLDNGMILKLYNESKNLSEIEKFKYFLKYKNENFLFPFDFIYDEELFYGHISKRSMGTEIGKCFSSINLNNLLRHAKTLENGIKTISDGKILIFDFSSSNVLYDNEKLEVIDHDFYQIKQDMKISEIKKQNIEHLRGLVACLFMDELIEEESARKIVEKIMEYEDYDNSIDDMIFLIKQEIEKHYQEQIDKIDDLKNILKG